MKLFAGFLGSIAAQTQAYFELAFRAITYSAKLFIFQKFEFSLDHEEQPRYFDGHFMRAINTTSIARSQSEMF